MFCFRPTKTRFLINKNNLDLENVFVLVFTTIEWIVSCYLVATRPGSPFTALRQDGRN